MMNQTVLVGRLVNEPTIKELESGKKVSYITLAVQRAYKNMDGEYETDFIPVVLWEAISTNVLEYCHKGDILGVKGRLQVREDKVEVVAEKVTFLSSRKPEVNE